jgi:phospholipid/cholesterol/gamma-HCH transport system permease protein
MGMRVNHNADASLPQDDVACACAKTFHRAILRQMADAVGKVDVRCEGGVVTLTLSGDFGLSGVFPNLTDAEKAIEADAGSVRYETGSLDKWDGSLVAALNSFERHAREKTRGIDRSGLPVKLRSMLEMADNGGKIVEAAESVPCDPFSKVGVRTTRAWRDFLDFLDFSGLTTIAFFDLVRGRSKMRWRDFWATMQSVSVEALGIVALISFLVGLIIAFLGAVVLRRFGAQFAIAYLVGYGILREMGAIMTGVIMAGRTGAAFAAQLGSMKVSEEIDALKTMGISPVEFLVLPRVVTLVLMMPILTVFADIVGIFGGYLVAVGMMGVPSGQFFTGLDFVAGPGDFFLGLFKGMVFGVLVAVSGCLRGMQCGRSADDVGIAATKAVVLGITLLIFANAVIDSVAAHFNI